MTDDAQPHDHVDVEDREGEHRFVIADADGDAQLVYRVRGDRLVLVHTEVPEALNGRGIGGRLVRAAIERARRTGETVVPSCPFAAGWLRAHVDEASTITIDWSGAPPAS